LQEILPLLRDITLILHFIGWAAVFGAWFAQVRLISTGTATVNAAMNHGIWAAFVTGLILVAFAEYRAATVADFEVDHFKIAIKTVVALVALVLIVINRKKPSVSAGVFGLIGLLVTANIAVAVLL
jgi:hypothetical protein